MATSHNIDFTTTTASDGWTKMKIADNVNLYMTNGKGSVGLGGGAWTTVTLRNKPIDLNLNNTFFSNTSARCGDAAINASPTVDSSNGNVLCQISNMYNQTVSSDIYYDAMIIEILR